MIKLKQVDRPYCAFYRRDNPDGTYRSLPDAHTCLEHAVAAVERRAARPCSKGETVSLALRGRVIATASMADVRRNGFVVTP